MNFADLRILIVEDDDFQRKIVVQLLHTIGIEHILSANNGKQALDMILGEQSRAVDIALCDLQMPEMDGMEFLRHLGQANNDIAVILVSSLEGKLITSVGRMAQMYGIHLLGIIEKPVMLGNLKESLLKFERSANHAAPAPLPSLSLDDILHGIRAGQFEPFFQPKVDMKTGRITGAEALARWNHPEFGIIGPAGFIPALERTRNIDDLTLDMLKKAVEGIREVHAHGHMLTVSVNLSLVSLDDTRLADRITDLVRECGLEPRFVILEITESAAMTDIGPALENLARLCMTGFTLSIDDYGTGSSNLQQLTRIAFGELKIDQSFVRDFADNKALRIAVESSIDMAHKLMVKSVAEGVETQRDWDALEATGCDAVQGYFIARPMHLAAFKDFLASDKHHYTKLIPPAVQALLRKTSDIKVLVVEDDGFTRKIILRVLREIGYASIADVENAAAAIQMLGSRAFDLVITDISMPDMNGLEFIQRIRSGKTAARRDTRLVILTSFSQTEILASALALDINGFLVKPMVPALVEGKLIQAMSERMHLHPPLAYEAVKTMPESLPHDFVANGPHRRGASIVMGSRTSRDDHAIPAPGRLPLGRLRAGMVLKEAVYLKDGTLIVAAGQTMSELSINRLRDLAALLSHDDVAAEEADKR